MLKKSRLLSLFCFGLLILIWGSAGINTPQNTSINHETPLLKDQDFKQSLNSPSNIASSGIIGSIDTNEAIEIIMMGDVAIVTDGYDGIKLINLSNPISPQIIGSLDTTQAHSIALDGKILYLGDMSGGFRCINVSNPTNPVQLSTYSTGGNAYGLDYYGDFVFQSNWDTQLVYILDLSNPLSAQLKGTMNVQAKSVLISGNLLFLAKVSSVVIYDISSPTAPVFLDEYTFSDEGTATERFWVDGNILYTARHEGGFTFLDIKNPRDIQFIGHIDTTNCATVRTYGELLIACDSTSGLHIYNNSNPYNPTWLKTYPASTGFIGMDFWGNYAIVTDTTSGIKIIKISEYISPIKLGAYATAAQSIGVYVDGDVAYMAAYGAGLVCLNVSNLASPTYLGTYNTPWNANDVVVSNNLAYVADSESGLQIINVTNPTAPYLVNSYNTPGNTGQLIKKGDLVFLADSTSLYILNVSNPTSPIFVGQYTSPQSVSGLAIQGDIAYYVENTNGGLYLININNPASPTMLGYLALTGPLHDVVVQGDYAFIPSQNDGLYIVNIKDPTNPTIINYYTPGNGVRLFVKGDILYVVSDVSKHLKLINITNPNAPYIISYYNSTDSCQNVFVKGNIAYLADHYLGLTTLKIAEHEWDMNIAPTIYPPVDRSWNVGTTGQILNWYVEDSTTQASRSYSIWQYSFCVAVGTWNTQTNITYSVPSLEIGTYYYQLQLNDGYIGGNSSDSVTINVLNVAPTLSSPSDQSWMMNTTGHSISWTPTDASTNSSSRSYTILCNMVSVSSGFWTTDTVITYIIDGLSPGSYEFLIWVDDGFSGNATDSVIVNVNGNAIPFLTSPDDQSWDYESTGHTLSWTPTDSTTQGSCMYTVWQNGSKTHTGTWTSGNVITFSLDGLAVGSYLFELQVNDGFDGANASDIVSINVLNILPILGSPDDQTWVANTTSHNINWTIVDSSTQIPRIYSIWHESTCIAVGNWITYNGISLVIDGLSVGIHTLEIQINDGYVGGNASDSVIVNVTANNLPSLSNPLDQIWNYDSIGHTLSWTPIDTTTQGSCVYTVWQNGSKTHTGTWTSGNSISYSLDGLAVGSYLFELQVNDGFDGANASDQVTITVLNVLPSLNSPTDQTWYFGTTGHNVNWTIVDNSTQAPRIYSIWHESTCISVGNWISYNGISLVVDGLAVGNHTVEIQINDGFTGGNASDSVDVCVILNIVPTLSTPGDQSFDYGTDLSISWTVTDTTTENTCTYSIWQNGSCVKIGTWNTGDTITYTVSLLAINIHIFEIQVNDGLVGGNSSDQVSVSVLNVLPSFGTHGTQSWGVGTTGHTLSWNPFDMSTKTPRTYAIWQNGICIITGMWTSGFSTTYNFDSLGVGSYGIEIQFNDGYVGGNSSESFSIIVTGNTNPIISSSADQSWTCGTIGHIVSWLPTDTSISTTSYYVYRNGTEIATNSWISGSDINVPIDGLLVGSYNFTCILYDGLGGSVQDEIIVTVTNGLPSLSAPANLVCAVGSTGNFLTWTPTDASTTGTPLYSIWDGSLCITTGIWTSGVDISYSVDGFTSGLYAIELQINDGYSGSNASNIVSVTVTSNVSPGLTTPADQSFMVGSTGHFIAWTVTDANVDSTSYVIYRNGTAIDSGSWINSEMISTSLNSLTPGIYNFTFFVNDGLPGGISSDEVWIAVCNNAPQLTHPADQSWVMNTTGHTITWTPTDTDFDSNIWYNITKNGSIVQNGVWSSGTNITLTLDSFYPGNYTIILVVSDGYIFNSSASDTVQISISNNNPVLNQPFDQTYSYQTSGHVIPWYITDANTMNAIYWIFVDNVLWENNSWISGQAINFSLNGLAVGTHNITIEADDGYGAIASDLVWVTVYDYSPAAPNLYQITPNPNSNGIIALNWSSVSFATNYSVYHYSGYITELNGSVSFLATTEQNSYVVSNLAEGMHYFVVIASNNTGDSKFSNCVSVSVEFPALPPQIIILQPTNGSIFTTLDNLVLNYYIANFPPIQNTWYMVNSSGQWISIGGNTTFNVLAAGTHSIVVRVRTAGENYTSSPAVFKVLIDSNPNNAALQIAMQVISGSFEAGQTIQIQVTVTNKGTVDLTNLIIYFNLSTSEYQFDMSSMDTITFSTIAVDQSKVFIIKIIPTVTKDTYTILGHFTVDSYTEEIAFPLKPSDSASPPSPLIYVFSISGAVALGGGAYYGMKKKKGNNGSKSFGQGKIDKHVDKNEPRLEHNEDGDFTW